MSGILYRCWLLLVQSGERVIEVVAGDSVLVVAETFGSGGFGLLFCDWTCNESSIDSSGDII